MGGRRCRRTHRPGTAPRIGGKGAGQEGERLEASWARVRAGESYRFITDLVSSATEEATATVAGREEKELADLQSSLGMGAKGRGVAKAQSGAAGQIKELEKEQKNRRTRMLRDSLDLALIDIAGLYRDAMMIAAGAVEGRSPSVVSCTRTRKRCRGNWPDAMPRRTWCSVLTPSPHVGRPSRST